MLYLVTVGFLFIATRRSVGADCEKGWTPFKNQLCIKAFTGDFLNFSQATVLCSSQGNTATLLMIKDSELQEILTTYHYSIFDHFWLGARFDGSAGGEFKWADGASVTYTNWATGYPKSMNGSERCIDVKPSISGQAVDAYWEDCSCKQRNLVICQKKQDWTLQDAVQEIIRIRNELNATREELHVTKTELEYKIEEVNNRVIPVGSIYVEYYNQRSPVELWPTLSWQDITSTYAGLFFRALGAGSERWGTSQSGCAPRITQTDESNGQQYNKLLTIPADGWSGWGHAGGYDPSKSNRFEYIRYYTAGCEVRPRNQAVRIWKRIN